MLQKTPKPIFWKFVKRSAKVVFVLEALAFAVSYGVWYRMNTNRDFREHMLNNFPIVLESYYKFGELLGNSRVREIDYKVWEKEHNNKTE